jgi:hypothetical protein
MRRWIRSWAAVLAVASTACQGSEAGDVVVSQAGAGPTIAQQLAQYTPVRPDGLQRDLDRLGSKGIAVDIVFEQGVHVLGAGR